MKIFKLLIMVILSLWADDGKELFAKHCASCHIPFVPMLKLKENFLKQNKPLKLKAPALNQLSYRLKQRIGDPKGDEDLHRMEVTAFMSDYVYNPDKDKSVCLEEVLSQFKTMPSLKGKVSEEELEVIGEYLYDFEKKVMKSKGVKYEGFKTALKRAKKENKLIMLEAMTSTCYFCKKMEREVMIEPKVVEAIEKDFIPVIIDVNKHSLPLDLKVNSTPSFIFIDTNKNIIMNIPGAWGKDDFLKLLKEVKTKRVNHENN